VPLADARLLDQQARPQQRLAHLERPDLADELQRARDFDAGITAPPLQTSLREIGNGFTEIAGGAAQALLLAGYRWWAPLLVGGAWLSTHVLLRESALWKIWHAEGVVGEQRHVDYAYRLAVDAPAAAGRIYTLGVPAVTFRDLAERARDAYGGRSRIVPVPESVVALVCRASQFLPLPVVPDQLDRLRAPRPPASPEAEIDLGFRPRPLRDVVLSDDPAA